MTEQQVTDLLNDAPYHYQMLGVGLTFTEEIDGKRLSIRRDKKRGGINVSYGDEVLHFVFNLKTDKWETTAPKLVSAR